MRPLVVRMAVWFTTSAMLSFLVSVPLVWLLDHEPDKLPTTLSFGLIHLVKELSAAPVERRQAILDAWQADAPEGVRLRWGPSEVERPSFAHGPPWSQHLASPDGSFGVRVSMDGPRIAPPVHAPLVGVTTTLALTLLTSVVVATPLARRLSRLVKATRELESGQFEVRVGDPTSDLVGELGRAFDLMAEKLHQRIRERDALIQAVAHEVGTPVSRVAFAVELLARGPIGADRERLLDSLRRDLAELDALTGELVAWVELGAQHVPRTETCEIVAVAEDIVSRELGPTSSPRWYVDHDEDEAWVVGDERELRRALANVVRNAHRHAVQVVRLSIVGAGDGVVIHVDDDGTGIPAVDRERIFEPFVRLDDARARDAGGLGLGLAIVQRVAQQAGGHAAAGESPYGGARITLALVRAERRLAIAEPT